MRPWKNVTHFEKIKWKQWKDLSVKQFYILFLNFVLRVFSWLKPEGSLLWTRSEAVEDEGRRTNHIEFDESILQVKHTGHPRSLQDSNSERLWCQATTLTATPQHVGFTRLINVNVGWMSWNCKDSHEWHMKSSKQRRMRNI